MVGPSKLFMLIACSVGALAYHMHCLDQATQRSGAFVSLVMVTLPFGAPFFWLKAAFLPYSLEAVVAEWTALAIVPFLNPPVQNTTLPAPDYDELRCDCNMRIIVRAP